MNAKTTVDLKKEIQATKFSSMGLKKQVKKADDSRTSVKPQPTVLGNFVT